MGWLFVCYSLFDVLIIKWFATRLTYRRIFVYSDRDVEDYEQLNNDQQYTTSPGTEQACVIGHNPFLEVLLYTL